VGAFVYAQRIPERWLPGRFDTWLHGHQIFHVLIVVAALTHYKSVMLLLHWRDASGGCAAHVLGGSGAANSPPPPLQDQLAYHQVRGRAFV
jgi:hypothetical protein